MVAADHPSACGHTVRGEQRTCGGIKAADTFSPASNGSVHIFVSASRAEFACNVHMPGNTPGPTFCACFADRAIAGLLLDWEAGRS